MLEYRKARREEREEYLEFADLVFGFTNTERNFEAFIPKVYGKDVESAHMQYIAKDERGIVGLVATLPQKMHAEGEILKTGYVGTVSTHPKARGEGHMKKLMRLSMEEMRENGTDIAFLGGQRQRYQYFGYHQAGMEYHIHIGMSNVCHALKEVDASNISFAPIQSNDEWEASAAQLHQQQRVFFEREGFALHCNTYHGKPYAILEDDEFVGYFVTNSNENVISEMVTLSMQTLDKALKAWITNNEKGVDLVFPEWQKDAIRHLNLYCEGCECTHSFLAKIINYPRVVGAMMKVKSHSAWLEEGTACFDVDGQRFTITVAAGEVIVENGGFNPLRLTEDEADQLFLYPFDYENRPDVPHNWFPLPLYAARSDEF